MDQVEARGGFKMTDFIPDTLTASEKAEASLAAARQLERNTALFLEPARLESGVPVLMFLQNDPAGASIKTLAGLLRDRGTPLFMAEEGPPAPFRLPVLPGLDPAVAPLLMIQSFYGLVNRVAVRRGYDPDHPPLLKKVTETL